MTALYHFSRSDEGTHVHLDVFELPDIEAIEHGMDICDVGKPLIEYLKGRGDHN